MRAKMAHVAWLVVVFCGFAMNVLEASSIEEENSWEQPVVGTLANETLQRDVLVPLYGCEDHQHPGCDHILVGAEVVTPPASGAWVERWLVKSCGEVHPHEITFIPDAPPQTGTSISLPCELGAPSQ